MKKINFLFIALILVLTSCSKDDETPTDTSTSGSVVGEWYTTSYTYTAKTVTEFLGETVTSDSTGEAYEMDYTLFFKENPNELTSEGSLSLKLKTTVMGETTESDIENFDILESGEWSRDGNILTSTFEGESQEMNIVELTDTTLVLAIITEKDLTEQYTGGIIEIEGLSVNVELNALITLERKQEIKN